MPKNTITITASQLFAQLIELGTERPAAFYVYAELAGIPEPRELQMHGDLTDFNEPADTDELAYLNRVFDGEIPSELLSNNWDT